MTTPYLYFPDLLPEFDLYPGAPWLPWIKEIRENWELEEVRGLTFGRWPADGPSYAYVRRGWEILGAWDAHQVNVRDESKLRGAVKALLAVTLYRLLGWDAIPRWVWGNR